MTTKGQRISNLRPFRPGQSGNPAGRPKQVATKLIREMAAELAEGSNETRLRRIINALLTKAEAGDLEAVKVVFDRLEGRPRQAVSLDLGERERAERMVEAMTEAEAAEGRECTREQAVAALSLFKPEIAEILS